MLDPSLGSISAQVGAATAAFDWQLTKDMGRRDGAALIPVKI